MVVAKVVVLMLLTSFFLEHLGLVILNLYTEMHLLIRKGSFLSKPTRRSILLRGLSAHVSCIAYQTFSSLCLQGFYYSVSAIKS